MPTTISEILGREAVPLSVEHNGKTYKARAFDLQFFSLVERHLEERDKRPALGLAGQVPPAALAALLEPHTQKVKDKAFRWGGPEHLAWLATPAGALEFSQMVFGLGEAEMTALALAKHQEVSLVIEQLLVESLPPAVLEKLAEARREQTAQQTAQQEGRPDPLAVAAS